MNIFVNYIFFTLAGIDTPEMGRHKPIAMIVTLCYFLSLRTFTSHALPTSLLNQSNNSNITNTTQTTTPASSGSTIDSTKPSLSDADALEQYIISILAGRIPLSNNTVQTLPAGIGAIQPSLLDYENQTAVDKLEKVVNNETTPVTALDIPADVYEVTLEDWISEEDSTATSQQEDERERAETQNVIAEAIQAEAPQRTTVGPHTIRHRGRRLAARSSQRRSNTIASLPIESLNTNNIQSILRQQQRQQRRGDGERRNPIHVLEQKERFNLTVDYQAPFQNIDKDKLLEILVIMNTDCSSIAEKEMIRWVSGKRGILFQCHNGAWVVTYLSRRQRKPRPSTITGT